MKNVVSFSSGRLGNLMFSVASGKYYADSNGYSFSLLRNHGHDDFLKTVEKTIFKNIKIVDSIKRSEYETITEHAFYDPIKQKTFKQNIFIDGYRESPKYWNDDKNFIFKLFKPEEGQIEKIKEVYSDVDFKNTVCINVRRGDYLKEDVKKRLGLLDAKYFYNCISNFPSNQHYIVVSDDIEWCSGIFGHLNVTFADRTVEGYDKTTTDLWLQTLCSNNIMSNSTFSWWGAYLNKTNGRKVYYPNPFFKSVKGLMEKIPDKDNWIPIQSVWDDNKEVKNLENLIKLKTKNLAKRDLNFTNPLTIQDKLAWLKVHDSTPLKTECSDKINLHNYCKRKLGKDLCIPIIATYDSVDKIDWKSLPNSFVIKCNHGSGMNIIVKNKESADKEEIKQKLKKWMLTDFSTAVCYEMNYKDIVHKIFVEEYKTDKNQEKSLFDYKFWCFNGNPELYTINDGIGHGDIMYYKIDGTPVDLYGNKSTIRKKPKHFEEMFSYAKELSSDFKFVRVDFYEVNDTVYLGEMTFYPGAGLFKYKDKKSEIMVGNMLKISDNKKVIYTCVTGGYDKLPEPKCIPAGYDFLCFTDKTETIKSNVWQPMLIPDYLNNLNDQKKQRYIKINAHKFLQKYDVSIYVDANVTVIADPTELLKKCTNCVNIPKHPTRTCIYEEIKACERAKKDTIENMQPQIDRYKTEGFPKNFGLTQNNIIVRYHNNEDCIKLMEAWWNEVEKGSYRDQLSLYYAVWKTGVNVNVLDKTLVDGPYFKWGRTHLKRPTMTVRTGTLLPKTEKKNILISRIPKMSPHLRAFLH